MVKVIATKKIKLCILNQVCLYCQFIRMDLIHT